MLRPGLRVHHLIGSRQYYRCSGEHGEKVIRREASEHGLPPGRLQVISPYDLDARYCGKRGKGWPSYKVHITETCSRAADDDPGTGRPAAPNLITSVATTEATVPDVAMTGLVHDMLDAAGLLPGEHAVDAGYTSADLLLAARARGITLVGPLLADTSPQARAGGYTIEAFTIDWEHQQVTCPQGTVSTIWSPCRQRGTEAIVVRFATGTCQACPAKDMCTRSSRSGRQLSLRPREIHEAVIQARAAQTTSQWKARYNIRAGVEGTMRQATHVTGIRRARYLGLAKTRLEHNAAAAAVNLIRLDAWWTGQPLDRTRTSHFQRLDLTVAA
jgi:Transposase DDE domain